jgi:hypothetical protein
VASVSNTAFGCLLIVAAFHFASRQVRKRSLLGFVLRLSIALGCVALIAALWFAVDLLFFAMKEPKRLFNEEYRYWVWLAVRMSPVLVLVHGRTYAEKE